MNACSNGRRRCPRRTRRLISSCWTSSSPPSGRWLTTWANPPQGKVHKRRGYLPRERVCATWSHVRARLRGGNVGKASLLSFEGSITDRYTRNRCGLELQGRTRHVCALPHVCDVITWIAWTCVLAEPVRELNVCCPLIVSRCTTLRASPFSSMSFRKKRNAR